MLQTFFSFTFCDAFWYFFVTLNVELPSYQIKLFFTKGKQTNKFALVPTPDWPSGRWPMVQTQKPLLLMAVNSLPWKLPQLHTCSTRHPTRYVHCCNTSVAAKKPW